MKTGLLLTASFLPCMLHTAAANAVASAVAPALKTPEIAKVLSDPSAIKPEDMVLLQQKAELGDALHQLALGYCYETGLAMNQNFSLAAKWYRKAAEQGLAEAQLMLGCLYNDGRVTEPKEGETLKWFRLAAEQGNAEAQFYLALCCLYGVSDRAKQAEAAVWMHKAATHGNAEAQYLMASMYAEGAGVAQDPVAALKWYRLAAKQGNLEARDAIRSLKYAKNTPLPPPIKENAQTPAPPVTPTVPGAEEQAEL